MPANVEGMLAVVEAPSSLPGCGLTRCCVQDLTKRKLQKVNKGEHDVVSGWVACGGGAHTLASSLDVVCPMGWKGVLLHPAQCAPPPSPSCSTSERVVSKTPNPVAPWCPEWRPQ